MQIAHECLRYKQVRKKLRVDHLRMEHAVFIFRFHLSKKTYLPKR